MWRTCPIPIGLRSPGTCVTRNRGVPGALTAIPENAFANARPAGPNARRVNAEEFAGGEIVAGAPVAPVRASVLGNAVRGGAVAHPREVAMVRPVMVKRAPPAAAVPFEAKQTALQQNQGRPLAPDQVAQLRRQLPAAAVTRAPVRTVIAPATPMLPPQPRRTERPIEIQPRPASEPRPVPQPASLPPSQPGRAYTPAPPPSASPAKPATRPAIPKAPPKNEKDHDQH